MLTTMLISAFAAFGGVSTKVPTSFALSPAARRGVGSGRVDGSGLGAER